MSPCKPSARWRIKAGLDRVDRQVAGAGSYLLGDRVIAADFVTTMLMRWSRKVLYEREGLTEWP